MFANYPPNEQVRLFNRYEMEKSQRKSVADDLKKYCHLAKEADHIEVCEWHNGEGFDVELSTNENRRFQFTWGEFKAIKKLVKEFDDE
jgi:hypothetical protein